MRQNVKGKFITKSGVFKILIYIIMITAVVTVLFPLYWVLVTSLKSNRDFYANIWGFPRQFLFENYARAWTMGKIGDCFLNSVIVTGGSILLTLLFSTTTGYVLARFNFRFGRFLRRFYMLSMMIPGVILLIPQFQLLMKINMLGSRTALILIYALGYVPFCQFLLYGFYKTIPVGLEEAATIDGAGYFKSFFLIMLPMVKSAVMTLTILSFISFWNEYILALVFLSPTPEKNTIPVGLAALLTQGEYRTEWGPLMAANVILLVPTVIIYVIFNSMIVSGMTVGAIKG